MKHFKGQNGYGQLFAVLFAIAFLIVLVIFIILGAMKIQNPMIFGPLAIMPPIIASYLAAGRFLAIEKRRPTGSERNVITLLGILYLLLFFGLLLLLGTGILAMVKQMSQFEKIFGGVSGMIAFSGFFSLICLHLNFGPISILRKQYAQ